MKRRRINGLTERKKAAQARSEAEEQARALGVHHVHAVDGNIQHTGSAFTHSGLVSEMSPRPYHSGNGGDPSHNGNRTVRRSLNEAERSAAFSVQDPEEREKLFEMFERRNSNGTAKVIGAHNGVSYQPGIPPGTRRVIRGTPIAPTPDTPPKALATVTPKPRRRRKKRIFRNAQHAHKGRGRGEHDNRFAR